jgi:hypothetical protein
MSKIYGTRGQIYRQADKSAMTVSKEGVARAVEEYHGLYADVVTQSPRLDDAHPDFPGLLLHTKSISRRREIGICVCDYRGLDPASDSDDPEFLPPPVYTLDIGLSTEPISTHPNFAALVTAAGGQGEGKAIFDADGIFVGFGKDSGASLVGVSQFLDATATWTVTTVQKGQPTGGGDVGKISSPPGGAPSYSGRTWLYGGMRWTREGGVYRVDRIWLLSKDGGWNTTIYSA